MSYQKQLFSDGQYLYAQDLNLMSEGILEAMGKSLPNSLMYYDNLLISDGSGDVGPAASANTRSVMGSFLAVNEGDSIILSNSDVKFIIYAYENASTAGFLGYVDANPEDSTSALKNWGNNFTFTNPLMINGAEVNVTYPIYVRLVFRHSDGISTILTDDFKNSLTYNVTANNDHLFGTRKNIVNNLLYSTSLISHRGLCAVAPENTLSSMKKAFDSGIKIIEIDIRMTKDNVPVLLHDSTIDRTSDGSGAIASLTYEQASQYDYGSWFSAEFSGEKLATLEDALIWAKTRGLCLELDLANRGFTVAQKKVIYNIILNLGMLDSTIFTATDAELQDYLSFDPQIIVSVSGITSISAAQSILPKYNSCGLVLASVPVNNLSKDLVSCIHAFKMKVKVWTIDDTTTRDLALSYGVDSILSDGLTALY